MKGWTKFAMPVAVGLGIVVITHLINRRKVVKYFSPSWSSTAMIKNKYDIIGPPVPKGYSKNLAHQMVKTAKELADKPVLVDYLDRDTVVNIIWNLGLAIVFDVSLEEGDGTKDDHNIIIKYVGYKNTKDWYAWLLQRVLNAYNRDVFFPITTTTSPWSWERNGQMIIKPWKYMSDSEGVYYEELQVRSPRKKEKKPLYRLRFPIAYDSGNAFADTDFEIIREIKRRNYKRKTKKTPSRTDFVIVKRLNHKTGKYEPWATADCDNLYLKPGYNEAQHKGFLRAFNYYQHEHFLDAYDYYKERYDPPFIYWASPSGNELSKTGIRFNAYSYKFGDYQYFDPPSIVNFIKKNPGDTKIQVSTMDGPKWHIDTKAENMLLVVPITATNEWQDWVDNEAYHVWKWVKYPNDLQYKERPLRWGLEDTATEIDDTNLKVTKIDEEESDYTLHLEGDNMVYRVAFKNKNDVYKLLTLLELQHAAGVYEEELLVRAKDEKPPTVAIDFDGVIAEYNGWKGHNAFGKPMPGVQEATQKIKEMGYYIVVFTTREDTPELRAYLKKHNVTFDDINKTPWNKISSPTSAKVIATVYIDDRAMNFDGNWDRIPDAVKNFKPWRKSK